MTETPEQRAARKAGYYRIPSEEEIAQSIEEARRPALLLNLTKYPDDPGEDGSWLWGQPTLPPEVDWPYQEINGLPWPLFFLAQINLASVPRHPKFPKVPETGTLFFFHDPVFSTEDSKVLYVGDDVSKVPPRPMPDPEHRPIDEWSDEDAFEVIDQYQGRRRNFDYLEIRTYVGVYNHVIYEKIRDYTLEEKEIAKRSTKDRWDFQEHENHIPDLLWAHLFGADPDPQIEGMILLLRIGGINTHDFWIEASSLEKLDFDQVILKSGRAT